MRYLALLLFLPISFSGQIKLPLAPSMVRNFPCVSTANKIIDAYRIIPDELIIRDSEEFALMYSYKYYPRTMESMEIDKRRLNRSCAVALIMLVLDKYQGSLYYDTGTWNLKQCRAVLSYTKAYKVRVGDFNG